MTALAAFTYGRGEARRVRLRLRRASDGSTLSVNPATAIYAVPTRVFDDMPLPPVYAARDSGVDDWTGGLVTLGFGAHNLTAFPGAYTFRLRVLMAGDELAFIAGRVVVEDTPRVEPFVLPGIGQFSAVVQRGIAAGDMAPGTPVSVTMRALDGTVLLAPIDAAYTPPPGVSVGLALSAASAGYGALWCSAGSVQRLDWSTIAPTAQLLPTTPYMVDTLGRISPTGTGLLAGTSDATGRWLIR